MFGQILSAILGGTLIQQSEVIDVEYEDVTPVQEHEEIFEDWTNGNPNKNKITL